MSTSEFALSSAKRSSFSPSTQGFCTLLLGGPAVLQAVSPPSQAGEAQQSVPFPGFPHLSGVPLFNSSRIGMVLR